MSNELWRPQAGAQVSPNQGTGESIHGAETFGTIQAAIDSLDDQLRDLSTKIHNHPELKYEEKYAHDVLSAFMEDQGFQITKHYHLETAWVAKFSNKQGGRTIGVNSEMDALPGIGHACGHNLIAISGVAVACAIKAVLEKHDIAGSVVLLGTPAEEGGYGKVTLLEKGAYEEMDICLMCHPAPGPPHSGSLSSSLALQVTQVEYTGHTAHAALSPWEGQNALDAAVAAYMNISLLRQQIKPSHRVHGMIEGRDWAPNVIPDYSKMTYIVRAETWAEVKVAVPRVRACLEAAGLATACKTEIETKGEALDLRQNVALGDEFASVFRSKYGPIDYKWGIASASTDFGHVTYALPSIHPGFGIPTVEGGQNHTREFAESAISTESHIACLNVSKALAAVGVRVLTDEGFFKKVKETFEEDKKHRGDAPV